jgi:glycosyltransferase involved in cell wall biosynthesis
MLISIIIPTINRKTELEKLLSSISKLKVKDFNLEIIIVDQNSTSLFEEKLLKFSQKLSISHYKVNFKGASKARNFGFLKSKGELLCFPDDDAKFYKSTILTAVNSMKKNDVDVLFGKCIDDEGNNSVINFYPKSAFLKLNNYKRKFIESTIFIKANIFKNFKFDETLGIGTFHGAEEAHDLVLRLLKANISIFYNPKVIFNHPSKIIDHSNPSEIRRVFSYKAGFSLLCKKHKLYFLWLSRFLLVSFYLPFAIFFRRKVIRYYISELLGLLSGLVIK